MRYITNRGYTGHEHLDAFGIINMNGRVYDPLTAQFFSPDPFVQAPDNWVNYNRYGYCMNNPLIYTDPTGNLMAWRSLKEGATYQQATSWECGGGGGGGFDGMSSSGALGGFSSAGHWVEDTNTTLMQYSYNVNENGEKYNYQYTYQTDVTSHWEWNSNEDRMYAVLHPNDIITGTETAVGVAGSYVGAMLPANSETFSIATMSGKEVLMTTEQLSRGLKIAGWGIVAVSIFTDIALAALGDQDAQQYLILNTAVNIAAMAIGGPLGLAIGVSYIVLKDFGAFDRPYIQNNYTPNIVTPQDAIRSQYPKDGPQPIYFHH